MLITLALAGGALIVAGIWLILIGRRLAGYITSEPMHREGDALFAYAVGGGYALVTVGAILALLALTLRLC